VCAREGNGEYGKPVDPNRVMVRARKKKHLQDIINRFEKLNSPEILDKTDTDYRYRIFVAKSVWKEVMYELTEELNYDNFKSEVKKVNDDAEYQKCLNQVWYAMYQFQERE
jgi:hypothetical protein